MDIDFTPKQLGNIGEAKTLAKFVEMGVPVYVAYGDNEKADMVADFNGKLNKIQAKSSLKITDGLIIVDITSTHRKNGRNVKEVYKPEDVDYFSIFNYESGMLILVPFEVVAGKTQLKIRYPYKKSTNQYKNINWEEYTFEKIMEAESTGN